MSHASAVASTVQSTKVNNYAKRNREEYYDRESAWTGQTIQLEQRLLIGRGRDGLIFRIGSNNMAKTGHKGLGIGSCWGGWVLKVPRFRLVDLPQHYLKAVASQIPSQNPEYHARNSMVANFNFEGELQMRLWEYLGKHYLPHIGFPEPACQPKAWQPDYSTCARDVHIRAQLDEDKQTRTIDAKIPREHCHMMPEGVMDAFQALVHHFTEALLLNFLRDILFQLHFLEVKGLVHGDFKLSNVLLFVWNDREYIFVLADFWDAYTVDSRDGSVVETKTNSEMEEDARDLDLMAGAGGDFRRILRWKFVTEKFGTRLYKDPYILNALRAGAKGRRRFRSLREFDAGKINLWSFGIVMASLLTSNRDNEKVKNIIKDDILFSGRANPSIQTLTEDEAVAKFRELYSDLLTPKYSEKDARRRIPHPNRLLGNSPLIDSLVSVIMSQCMNTHSERGTTKEVIDALALHCYSPEAKERDIARDLHSCGRCTMCNWMVKNRGVSTHGSVHPQPQPLSSHPLYGEHADQRRGHGHSNV